MTVTGRSARAGARAVASVLGIAVTLAALACAPSPSITPAPSRTPRPTLEPRLGLTWEKAPAVGRAGDLFPVDSDPSHGPDRPGTAGHPGHFPGQEVMTDVAHGAGRFVAVGYGGLRGEWTARGWSSTDGLTWTETTIDDTIGSFAMAIAATPEGRFIAVGRSGRQAMAWTTEDGEIWVRSPLGPVAPEPAERASAIAVTELGVFVGGSYGPELGDRTAVFWTSKDDGRSWSGGPRPFFAEDQMAGPDPFAGGEVSGIVQAGDGLVAIGRLGTGQRWTGSVAWTWEDGGPWAWVRIDDPALAGGLAVALVATADGLLAVGSDGDEREAVAWSSADGTAWERAPSETSRLHYGQKVRMTDVVATADGYTAVGNYVGVQYGQGTSWISSDGLTWERAPDQAVWGQGEPSSLIVTDAGMLSVGTFGAPDDYIPTIWLSPGLS